METTEIRQINRGALAFILTTAFLNLAGIGLIAPVSPFLVELYVTDPEALALANGLLFTAYSFFQFIALPGLGALSDRYGRRPVLLISLLGSAVGYFIFGLGGALWVLFLGRIIDGITGANLSAIYAYIADLTPPRDRTRYYGLIGAVSGFGFVVGPAIGGVLGRIGPEAPVFFAAFVTLLNVVWGYFVMQESLPDEERIDSITIGQLNPLTRLTALFQLPELFWLLLAGFLYTVPFAQLQANLSVLAQDQLNWTTSDVAVVFTIIGVIGVIVQGGLIRVLLRYVKELPLAIVGVGFMLVGYVLIAQTPVTVDAIWIYLGSAAFAVGNSLFLPSLTGLLSQQVEPSQQGRVQGGNQSVQALGRVVGPVIAGVVYGVIGPAAPYWLAAFLVALAAVSVLVSGARERQRGQQGAG